jgi:uncharacterized membrane protein YidH (DUF202 family)
MKIIGIVLVALGVLALVYGGFSYNRDRTVLQMGSMEMTATENQTVPVPATVGLVVLLGGVALIVFEKRRPRSS